MVFDGAMPYGSVRGLPLPDSVHATVRTLLAAQSVPADPWFAARPLGGIPERRAHGPAGHEELT